MVGNGHSSHMVRFYDCNRNPIRILDFQAGNLVLWIDYMLCAIIFVPKWEKTCAWMEPKKNNNIWTIMIAVMLQFEVWKYSIESYYKPFRVHLSLWAVTKSQCKWYSNLHKRKKCDCRKKKVASVWLNTIVSAKLSSALYATSHKKEILNKYNCLLLNANDNDTDWTMSASWTAETFL